MALNGVATVSAAVESTARWSLLRLKMTRSCAASCAACRPTCSAYGDAKSSLMPSSCGSSGGARSPTSLTSFTMSWKVRKSKKKNKIKKQVGYHKWWGFTHISHSFECLTQRLRSWIAALYYAAVDCMNRGNTTWSHHVVLEDFMENWQWNRQICGGYSKQMPQSWELYECQMDLRPIMWDIACR